MCYIRFIENSKNRISCIRLDYALYKNPSNIQSVNRLEFVVPLRKAVFRRSSWRFHKHKFD